MLYGGRKKKRKEKKVVTMPGKTLKKAYLISPKTATQGRKSHTTGKSLNMPEATDKCKAILGVQQSYKQAKKIFQQYV